MTMPNDIHWDFSALLLVLAIGTGLVTWWWKRKHGDQRNQVKQGFFVENCRGFFPVILIVLVLRSFVIEPFRIPSGSMLPTLNVGDFIVVNKFSYGLRLPVFHNKFLSIGEPEVGDVAVFRYPPEPAKDYIKRIIGKPGDTIRYVNKRLTINGEELAYQYRRQYDEAISFIMREAEVRTERLGDVEHDILVLARAFDQGGEVTVPEGHYFVMGDNRDNSEDSRRWGFVPERNLVGKAVYIWMNWDSTLGHPDWGRIGTTIR
jgi:signal peptidase I